MRTKFFGIILCCFCVAYIVGCSTTPKQETLPIVVLKHTPEKADKKNGNNKTLIRIFIVKEQCRILAEQGRTAFQSLHSQGETLEALLTKVRAGEANIKKEMGSLVEKHEVVTRERIIRDASRTKLPTAIDYGEQVRTDCFSDICETEGICIHTRFTIDYPSYGDPPPPDPRMRELFGDEFFIPPF